MPITIRTLFPSRGSPISLPALTKLDLFGECEAALNARTMVFGTLKKSQAASNGFRHSRPEFGCETPESEVGGSQEQPKMGLKLGLARVLAFTGVLFLDLLVGLLVGLLVLARVLILCAERSLQRGKQGRSLDCYTGPGDQSCERRTSEQSLCRLCHLKDLLSIRVRNGTPTGRSFHLVDREPPCPLRLDRLPSAEAAFEPSDKHAPSPE